MCLEVLHPYNNIQENEDLLVAFKATVDPDTMYLHQAMKEPDRAEFLKAMTKEVHDLMQSKTLVSIKQSEVPEGVKVLPVIWQMKRKRDIKTHKIKKWKARLNLDGS